MPHESSANRPIAYQQVELQQGRNARTEFRVGPRLCLFHVAMRFRSQQLRMDMPLPNALPAPVGLVPPQSSVHTSAQRNPRQSGNPFFRADYQFSGPAFMLRNSPDEEMIPTYLVNQEWFFEEQRRIRGPNPNEDLRLVFCQSHRLGCEAIGYIYRSEMYIFGFHCHGPQRAEATDSA
jgi:hypothetical protein